MRTLRAVAALAGLSPLAISAQSPQPPPPPPPVQAHMAAMIRLSNPLAEIRTRLRAADTSSTGNPRLFTAYDRLQRAMSARAGLTFPTDFVESLDLLTNRIELANQDSLLANQAAALETADQDLLLKAQFLELSSGAGFGTVGVIRVVLSTVRDTAQVMGLSVSSDPFLFADSLNPRFVFNNTTSPTETALPPGAYMLFIRDAGGRIIARKRIDLGATGRLEEEIRIEIPPQ